MPKLHWSDKKRLSIYIDPRLDNIIRKIAEGRENMGASIVVEKILENFFKRELTRVGYFDDDDNGD